MADVNKLKELIAGLAKEGFQLGDIMKSLKEAKEEGVITSKGRGKLPENDPLRQALIAALNGVTIDTTVDGTAIKGKLIDLVANATPDATSLMVTLNDNWKVNFVKNVPKEKKEKQEKKETQPADFAEPAVV